MRTNQHLEQIRAGWFDKPLEDIKERYRDLTYRDGVLSRLELEEMVALEGYIEHMTGRKA